MRRFQVPGLEKLGMRRLRDASNMPVRQEMSKNTYAAGLRLGVPFQVEVPA